MSDTNTAPIAPLLEAPPEMPPVQGVASLADLFNQDADPYANPMNDITAIASKLPDVMQVDAPPAQAPTEPVAPVAPAAPPVDWEKRYKDLQSYHDEQRVYWEKVQQALGSSDPNEVAQARAIREAIVQDPELFGIVSNKLAGQPVAVTHQSAQSGPPPRPANFDPDDLYTPGTPSYEWAQRVEAYKQDQLVANVAKVVDTRLSAIEQARQQELLRSQQAAARQAVRQHASATFQDPRDVDTFSRFVDEGPAALGLPRQLSLEHLTAIYRALQDVKSRAPQSGVPVTASPATQADQVAARLAALKSQAAPPPLTSVTQAPGEPSQLAPGDDFMAGIKAASAKRFNLF